MFSSFSFFFKSNIDGNGVELFSITLNGTTLNDPMMCSITLRAAYIASLKSASIASAMAHGEESIRNIYLTSEEVHIL